MSDKFRVLDGEIDLEHDDVRDSQGHRIDADYGDRAVADAHARRGRRPLGDSTPVAGHYTAGVLPSTGANPPPGQGTRACRRPIGVRGRPLERYLAT